MTIDLISILNVSSLLRDIISNFYNLNYQSSTKYEPTLPTPTATIGQDEQQRLNFDSKGGFITDQLWENTLFSNFCGVF